MTITMESSRRDLFIDMVVHRFIFKHNQITLSPFSTFETFVHSTFESVRVLDSVKIQWICRLAVISAKNHIANAASANP